MNPHPLLTLRPISTALGTLDGMWSPESRDITVEVARIARELSLVVGPISRIVYRINDWGLHDSPNARTLGADVCFEGYWRPKYATNTFIGPRGSIELATLMPPVLIAPKARTADHARPRRRVAAVAAHGYR